MLLSINHFPERRLTNGVLLAPRLLLIDDVAQDDVEGHPEVALQLGIVRVAEDAFL